MRKRIAIDALQLQNAKAGVGNYQYNLINELKQYPYDFDVYTGKSGLIKSGGNINVIEIDGVESSKSRLLYQSFAFAKRLCEEHYDLVHFLDYFTPIKKLNCRSVTTVHDVGFLESKEFFPKSATFFKSLSLPRAIKNSNAIITVSDFTKFEILKHFPKTDDKKIVPIHLGVYEDKSVGGSLPLGVTPPYVLSVSTVEPRKNYISLIKSMEILWDMGEEASLVIAGGFGWLYENILSYAKASKYSNKIKFTGYVDDKTLSALYKNCELFAFPSKYEGFGLTPLEAMAKGIAVVSSDCASLPEVLGDGTIYAKDEQSMAEAIKSLFASPVTKGQLIERGLARACKFTWDKTAEKTIKVYEGVLYDEEIQAD